MNWKNIKKQQPEIGVEVEVFTIYGTQSNAFWNGEKWLTADGRTKGTHNEAPKWRYIGKMNPFLKRLLHVFLAPILGCVLAATFLLSLPLWIFTGKEIFNTVCDYIFPKLDNL